MDDAADNVIPIWERHVIREELAKAVEWLDDLDSPLTAERASVQETRSARIHRAPTAWSTLVPGPAGPPNPAA